MTTAMERTWSLYEAEKATGSAETAEMIGNAYTVLDQIELGNVEESFAWNTYYGISKAITKELIHGEETNAVSAYRMLEEAMVEAGLLEADEEPEEEDLNTSTNWDEWAAEQRFDAYREDRMAYEM